MYPDKKSHITQQEDYISSGKAKEIFGEQMKHDDNRAFLQKIISEYVDSVPFMEKVQRYAGMEIDKRLFTTWRYYLTAIVTAIVTTIIALVIGKFLK